MNTPFDARRRAIVCAAPAALLLAGCGDRFASPAGLFAFHEATMGSTYTVKLFAPGLAPGGRAEARAAVEAALAGVVARMSTFDAESELARFNRHASTRPFALSADTLRVIEVAHEVSAASHGAFDVSVAPVVDAWGFGAGGRRARPPEEALRHARAVVDWRALEPDRRAGTLAKGHPAMAADLCGIAKGYGVDLAAAALGRLGFDRYLVEVGGEMRARGTNARGQPWQLGIERPDAMPQRAHRIVGLTGGAIATSGDYRIYFAEARHRYSHEIDPRTGAPTIHRLASVSVVAADCTRADAWATALYVLGADAGMALATERGLAAFFIERSAAGAFAERSTPAFAALGSRIA
jgi:thiamine biosynthesis lipoprotein